MNTVVKTISQEAPQASSVPTEPVEIHSETPTEADGIDGVFNPLLDVLGIEDTLENLTEADGHNLNEIEEYLGNKLKAKKVPLTIEALKNEFASTLESMGIDKNTEPSTLMDRVAGVINGWKSLSFVTDPKEKRSIFMKLSKMQSSVEMNKFIFQEMNKKEVWL